MCKIAYTTQTQTTHKHKQQTTNNKLATNEHRTIVRWTTTNIDKLLTLNFHTWIQTTPSIIWEDSQQLLLSRTRQSTFYCLSSSPSPISSGHFSLLYLFTQELKIDVNVSNDNDNHHQQHAIHSILGIYVTSKSGVCEQRRKNIY